MSYKMNSCQNIITRSSNIIHLTANARFAKVHVRNKHNMLSTRAMNKSIHRNSIIMYYTYIYIY